MQNNIFRSRWKEADGLTFIKKMEEEKKMLIEQLREITFLSIIGRVLLAIIIGGIIGLERGIKNQPAGTRTYMVVCLGACVVMMTNQYIYHVFQTGDPTRLGAQVVSGIGFLGAGTILVTKNSRIRGLTSAAGLWASACIGLAIGIGFYEGAIAAGITLLLIMTFFRKIDNFIQKRSRYIQLYINFDSTNALNSFIEQCKREDIAVNDAQITKIKGEDHKEVIAMLAVKTKLKLEHSQIIAEFAKIDGIKYIEEI